MKVKLLVSAVLSTVCSLLHAQGLVPDNSFGTMGRVVTSFGPQSATLNSLALQSDGKILACGSYMTYLGGPNSVDNQVAVKRFNADGTPDETFGTDGKVLIPIGGEYENEYNSIRIVANNKILIRANSFTLTITGTFPFQNYIRTYDYALIRLNQNGSPDETFGPGGIQVYDFGLAESGWGMDIQTDNKIVLGGTSYETNSVDKFAVSRYWPDGSKDTGFGDGGQIIVSHGVNTQGKVFVIKIQPDGKIIAAGRCFTQGESGDHFALLRLNSDGSLDDTFGNNGKIVTQFEGGGSTIFDLQLLPDGKILAIGTYFFNGDSNQKVAVAKYNANGSLDTSYNADGKMVIAVGSDDAPVDFAFSSEAFPNGELMVVGMTRYNNQSHAFMLKLNEDGTPDSTFGSDGVIQTNAGDEAALDLMPLPNGEYILGGIAAVGDENEIDFALWKWKPSTLAAQPFKINHFSVFPNPFEDFINVHVEMDPQQSLSINLHDLSGRKIKEFGNQTILSGKQTIRLDMIQIPNGVYMLQIETPSARQTCTIIK